ncbi:hypothetical protein TVAG_505590 [Trichomonas vaginalis G3]|uniref:Surface antigen BspA-like n=1 Tax=Trichomonas vaginalis (strain ATCC PRA-98 / G3) TaxID=412133 RepID=A2GFI3_TRIV3|nr:ribonuclease inhibitor domain-containing protein [Trichomonas vaginalis G3]XP_051078570.1 ribonuclease inhibitor domain-containing protein [Trichomonas vaginalis G3]EAX84085.1 hypothetical protein TVAG_505590 [Trichomonas vaginalis G3]KAI5486696.1 ribonuclease inhibitor domain-containing protein [Trichomonas vaginalis G3]KAI5486705.1 ribonuclease inhibitor domain-containing protein [Trichomonas vaginalis G3]|eukprot:XP_001297015.1 hypothetical protein [Trichomonas vaginalis G3]
MSLSVIGIESFSNCNKLTQAVFYGKISLFNRNVFFGCNSLSFLVFADDIDKIYPQSFSSSLEKLSYCGHKPIDNATFYFRGQTKISVTRNYRSNKNTIGKHEIAFERCPVSKSLLMLSLKAQICIVILLTSATIFIIYKLFSNGLSVFSKRKNYSQLDEPHIQDSA